MGSWLRFFWVVLVVVLGCDGDDDGGAEDGGAAGTSGAGASGAGAGGSAGDPGPVIVPPGSLDSGADPVPVEPVSDAGDAGGAIDAGMPDAAAAPTGPLCDDSEMPCGEDCILRIEPTLDDLQKRIFGVSCGLSTSCHSGSSAKEGLDLSTAAATFSFVGEPSTQMPSAELFDESSPEDSYVLRKLRGMRIADESSTGVKATQMPPPPSTPLCAEKIDMIEAWVRAGAPR